MSYILIVLIIALDQVSKYYVQANLLENESIPVIQNIFHITYVHNYGAAFGILRNHKIFFIVITTAVVIGIFLFLKTQSKVHATMKYSLMLIIAGAVGNLMDRIQVGYVRDFFDFRIWPVFNIADMAIVCGAILLSYYLLIIDRPQKS
ncbi:signal peptidase II [Anaerosolibacter carboniphilus]|uniref:Lipoprotein signal peptidase n=1 Tax=Anaerosolibacter carboniphilus TaxID=1417629 RepID=A0A841KU94_9FIRM|nr:signal peptidase II [Anaerosolibacter carboniphilus]MBB6216967.1 signal peptidase II [Anaerosolibacter carboniphilus]